MKSIIATLVALTTIGVGMTAGSVAAARPAPTHFKTREVMHVEKMASGQVASEGSMYLWAGNTVVVDNHTPWGAAVRDAVNHWDAGLKLHVVMGKCHEFNINNIACVPVFDNFFGRNNVAGMTWVDHGYYRMFHADVHINESYRPGPMLRDQIITHELGHALGFEGHWYGNYAMIHDIMYYGERPFMTEPTPRDFHLLNAIRGV